MSAAKQRAIFCPGVNRWVSMRCYVQGVKLAKANPDATFKQGITCWWPVTGREIVEQFRAGMQDRITQGIPYNQRGIE